jgi:hypothetical protein
MRTIAITFRAVFEFPTGPLNPMGVRLAGPQPVEIFKKGEFWYARELSSPKRHVFERLGKFGASDSAKQGVEAAFLQFRQPWQVWGIPPKPPNGSPSYRPDERVLLPHEFTLLPDGKAAWYTAEDQTHIIHNAPAPHVAACGEKLPSKCFINNRANVRPSCPGCAEVWEKEYKDK